MSTVTTRPAEGHASVRQGHNADPSVDLDPSLSQDLGVRILRPHALRDRRYVWRISNSADFKDHTIKTTKKVDFPLE